MNETNRPEDNIENVDELIVEQGDSGSERVESPQHRWREAFRRSFLGTPQSRTPATKRDLSQDRSRALLLLIGGVVGSVVSVRACFQLPTSLAVSKPRTMSVSRDRPRHITIFPGGGSLFRAR
jgi:hypothetical protein